MFEINFEKLNLNFKMSSVKYQLNLTLILCIQKNTDNY